VAAGPTASGYGGFVWAATDSEMSTRSTARSAPRGSNERIR